MGNDFCYTICLFILSGSVGIEITFLFCPVLKTLIMLVSASSARPAKTSVLGNFKILRQPYPWTLSHFVTLRVFSTPSSPHTLWRRDEIVREPSGHVGAPVGRRGSRLEAPGEPSEKKPHFEGRIAHMGCGEIL